MNPKVQKALAKKFRISEAMAGDLEYRRTGRSTARALAIIAEAIMYSNKEISIWDHSTHFNTKPSHSPTHEINRRLAKSILKIIKDLDLKYMKVSLCELTLTFDLKAMRKDAFGIGWI